MQSKIKVLFDARPVVRFFDNTSYKSGIYFVSLNILKELSRFENLEITLWCDYFEVPFLKVFKLINADLNVKLRGGVTLWNAAASIVLYLKHLFRKTPFGDNIFKKAARFILVRISRLIFRNLSSRQFIDDIRFDVVLSTKYAIPDCIAKNSKAVKALVLYDTIPIDYEEYRVAPTVDHDWFYNLLETIPQADICFTISNHAKNDFLRHFPNCNPEKFISCYLAADDRGFSLCLDSKKIEKIKKKYKIGRDKKYIFALANIEPRKNFTFVMNNFKEFVDKFNLKDELILLLGGDTCMSNTLLNNEIKKFTNEGYVLPAGYVDDKDLPLLYAGAEFFVYPSLYEGFGLPVLEAMTCGCPVITSNTSSLPEVIGDCGIMINPKNKYEMQNAFTKLYFNRDFRNECIVKGLARSKEFSWKKTASIIIENLEKIIKNRPLD